MITQTLYQPWRKNGALADIISKDPRMRYSSLSFLTFSNPVWVSDQGSRRRKKILKK
jgi:hypothetical protein